MHKKLILFGGPWRCIIYISLCVSCFIKPCCKTLFYLPGTNNSELYMSWFTGALFYQPGTGHAYFIYYLGEWGNWLRYPSLIYTLRDTYPAVHRYNITLIKAHLSCTFDSAHPEAPRRTPAARHLPAVRRPWWSWRIGRARPRSPQSPARCPRRPSRLAHILREQRRGKVTR